MSLKGKLKKFFASALSALTFASVVTVPAVTTPVSAASAVSDANLYTALKGLTGIDLSDKSKWINNSYLSEPQYGDRDGYTGVLNNLLNGDYGTLRASNNIDCVGFAFAAVGHALKEAGANPNEYITRLAYNFNGNNKFSVSTDPNTAKAGDIIMYGNGVGYSHLAVCLGWKNGVMYMISGSNYGHGPIIQEFSRVAGSGGTTAAFTAIYELPHETEFSVSVKKVADATCANITDNNPVYSDLSATFGVYFTHDDAVNGTNQKATIKTNAAGISEAVKLKASSDTSSVYVKELIAPAYYELNNTVYTVDVSSGAGVATISDKPLDDPATIVIQKKDVENKENAPSLAGAEFTFKYYAVDPEKTYSADELSQMNATRTWTFKTREDGILRINDPNCFVNESSDQLYKRIVGDQEFVTIPIGVLTIQETKAPTGYTVEGGYLNSADGEIKADANETLVFNVTGPGSISTIVGGNVDITKKENSLRAGFKVVKQDYKTGNVAEGDASLAGAEFDLYYLGDGTDVNPSVKLDNDGDGIGDSAEFNADDKNPIAHIVLGTDGTYTSSPTYLGYGKYRIIETKAPTGYSLTDLNGGDITKDFVVSENGQMIELAVENYPVLGGFQIQKNDNTLKQPYAQGDTKMQTVFEIRNASAHPVTVLGRTYAVGEAIDIEGNGQLTFTTDEVGYYQSAEKVLPYGTYTINEVTAPEGHTSEGTTTVTFSVRNAGEMVNLTSEIFNDVVRGGIRIQKNDLDYDTRSQGDTNLQATFEIVNKSANDVLVDADGDGKINVEKERFAPGAKIMEFTTDMTGFYESAKNLLPYGTYQINETIPPEGYTDEGKTSTTVEIRENEKIEDLTTEIKNRVDYGKFSVYKVAANSKSDWTEPEKDVEFTAILSSKIGKGKAFETFNDAYKAIEAAGKTGDISDTNGKLLLTVHEYAVITTDDEGKATSNDLAYGTYTIRQTSHVTDREDVKNEATFVVSKDGQETVNYTATNTPQKYRINIIKKDADTNKNVSLNSAEFKIFQLTDGKGKDVNEYVKQKVGLFTYDTFKTNSDGSGLGVVDTFSGIYTDSDDEKGTITAPLELESGTYRIEEVKTPGGFLALEEPVEFTVRESTITRRDEDGDAIIEVVVSNKKPHGKVEISKSLEDYKYDQSLLRDGFDYSGIKFEVKATEDIIDPADGSVITKAGEIAKNVYGEEVGTVRLDEKGNASVGDLPMGKYTLVETEVPAGVVLDETEHNFEITQEDQEANHLNYKVIFDDSVATTDWSDTTKIQTAEGTIVNKVTKVAISKKAVTGDDELEGATLTVKDASGNVVQDKDGNDLTWVSGKKAHVVEGLHIGETYILEETIAVDGYVKATDVEFQINKDGSVTPVTMIDKVVSVSKIDMGGKEIEGAEMNVTDEEGNIIDSWTSDGKEHRVNGLEEGKKYVLNELVAPEGYAKATSIPFEVTDEEDGVKVDQHIDMTDKKVTLNKTDGEGNEVPGAKITITDENGNVVDKWTSGKKPHDITGLEVGKKYTWHEDYSEEIFGYYYAEDYTFEVTDDGIDQELEMVDAPIRYSIAKVDDEGNNVKGVTLKLTDITNRNNPVDVELPNGGVTTDKPITLDKVLVAGHSYALVEAENTEGVHMTETIEFTVPKYGTSAVTVINMHDANNAVSVNKIDNYGNPVKGAKLQIIEAELEAGDKVDDSYAKVDENEVIDPDFNVDDTVITKPEDGAIEDLGFAVDPEPTVTDEAVSVQSEDNGENVVVSKPEEGTQMDPAFGVLGDITISKPEEGTTADGNYALDETVVSKPENGENPDAGYAIDNSSLKYVPVKDENGNDKVVYEFESTDDVNGVDISQYVKGDHAYILREVESPFGYQKIDDYAFTVTGTKDAPQTITAIDAREQYNVSITKVDKDKKSTLLEGAEITLFNVADGKVAKDVNGAECKALTDKNGKVSWNVEYNGSGYYAKETKAPAKYNINEAKFAVELSKDFFKLDQKIYMITIEDEAKKAKTSAGLASGIAISCLAGTAGLGILSKKKKKEEDE